MSLERHHLRLRRRCAVGLAAGLLALAGSAGAEPTSSPRHIVDLGARLAQPAALATGMSTGLEAGYSRRWLRPWLAWGVRASWSTATEYTLSWAVRHDDVRLRVLGLLQRPVGRGTLGLRLGIGATLVHEGRTRQQGSRAGLTGDALETSAVDMLPAADLEGLVRLQIWGPWGVVLSGGPSLHILDRAARVGWLAGLGVTWQR